MAKKGLVGAGAGAIARMNFADTDLDDSDEEFSNFNIGGSKDSQFKSVNVGKGAAAANASLNRPDTPEDDTSSFGAGVGRGSGASGARSQRPVIGAPNPFSFDDGEAFSLKNGPPAQGSGFAGIRARKAEKDFDFGEEEALTDMYGNTVVAGNGPAAARVLQRQQQQQQQQQQQVVSQTAVASLPNSAQPHIKQNSQGAGNSQLHVGGQSSASAATGSSMGPTATATASATSNMAATIQAAQNSNLDAMKAQLDAEERQLAEMESVQAKQAELAARRAKLERARYEAEAALTEARMQNEAAQIALLEQETQALTRKRKELEARKGGVPPSIDEGIAMPSMIEQPMAVAPALMSKRSLYDMMGAEAASNAAEQAGVTKGIYPLSEAEQEATDVEDERDPVTGRGGVSSRRERDSVLHAAAGEGRLDDVRRILSTDPALAHSVDNVNRNALFYACVNGHVEIVQLLMAQAPESCLVADVNGDTALHAAVSAGAQPCARMLLQCATANICEIENVLGMRPAHLAKDRSCIELLASAGAILNCEDKQLRVPLFVACAMDRLEVARYLCEVLQASPDELSHMDHRGDTPMHAAACNGSASCVQMFLDLGGLSMETRNKKGYRPVDLAARRGHAECERILATFVSQQQPAGNSGASSGYFDDILFQATVRGRQMCEEAIEADGEYEIIRHSNPTATDDEVRRMHSMWSSRREKSMRLQQYGNWIAYEDKVLKTVFWYNSSTMESQWDKPDEVTAIQNAKLAEAKGSWEALRKTSMRLKRIGEWVEYHGNGKTFYFKESTGEFMYERPIEMVRSTNHISVGNNNLKS